MVSYESLYDISETIKAALIAASDENDADTINLIKQRPFGGIHILMTGDLYQLKPITGTALFNNFESDKVATVRGRAIWHSMTDYYELTEACRYLDGNNSILAAFLSSARKGVVKDELLKEINARYCMSTSEAITKTHEKAIWMANTKIEVAEINEICYNNLIKQNKISYTIIAEHVPGNAMVAHPSEKTREELFKYDNDQIPLSHLDIAYGSRMSINQNLATQAKVFNGAIGTVRGNNTTNIN